MFLLLLKDSHKLLGLLRFEVLENLKEKHKKSFYNCGNKRKQKQTSQRRILKGQKNRTERKEKVTKDYNLPTPRALERHILGLSIAQNIQTGFWERQTFSNVVILLFSNIETLISMSSEPESSKSL